MSLEQRKNTVISVMVGFCCFFSQTVPAVLFEPGVGIGLKYTDNATLVNDENKVNDLITVGSVGAHLSENEGALIYDATAAFSNTSYTQDTFPDRRYFNLGASADWAMVKERFNWFMSDYFTQRTVVATAPDTPDNLQDSNKFTFGANIRTPISARQNFSLIPMFQQYYFELSPTNNKQYSLVANWSYQMYRLTSVGFNLSARKINYTEENLLGLSVEDATFTSMAIIFDGQRLRSNFLINIGATNVKRDNGQEHTGFSGYLNWLAGVSSRSTFETLISTDLTDTSKVAFGLADDPGNAGDASNDVQITSDVVRSSIIRLSYLREDASLSTNIWARYHDLEYSENPLDRIIKSIGLRFNHPVTRLLSSDAYANYRRIKQLDTNRLDEYFNVGGSLRYNFSRKLHGLLDVRYGQRESTTISSNYDEYSTFVSLVYGFGGVRRP